MNTIPVTVHGMTWGSALLALLNLLVGGALVSWIRTRASMKKIEADREANLLQERAAEMRLMRERIEKLEAALETRETLHAAERALDRHRINNLTSCLDALLFMLESLDQMPVKVAEAIARIRDMRARQMEAETLEKTSITAAKITKLPPEERL